MHLTLVRTIFAGAAIIAATAPGHAAPMVTASLYSPLAAMGTVTAVTLNDGSLTPSQDIIVRNNKYALTTPVTSDEGLVRGNADASHAVPVAGETASGAATYLTGDFGSAQTTALAASGNYLSVGANGFISIDFTTTQNAFALLWGSIDAGNKLEFFDGTNGTLQATITGAQVEAATAGFIGDGFEGPGGSAYVLINNLSFSAVIASNSNGGTQAFEFTAPVAFAGATSVPEPASLALFGAGLVCLDVIRRRKRRSAQCVQFSERPKRKLSA